MALAALDPSLAEPPLMTCQLPITLIFRIAFGGKGLNNFTSTALRKANSTYGNTNSSTQQRWHRERGAVARAPVASA